MKPFISSIAIIEIQRIQKQVAKMCGVHIMHVVGPTRAQQCVLARHIAMYIVRHSLDLSYSKIALAFGRKNHTTAIHAVKSISKQRKKHIGIDALLKEFEV